MAINPTYANNYWRKVFTNNSKSFFKKKDFDKWYWGKAKPIVKTLDYHSSEGTYDLGSEEHKIQLINVAFEEMLNACARGDFGTTRPARRTKRKSLRRD